jgi:hypothetical protein
MGDNLTEESLRLFDAAHFIASVLLFEIGMEQFWKPLWNLELYLSFLLCFRFPVSHLPTKSPHLSLFSP